MQLDLRRAMPVAATPANVSIKAVPDSGTGALSYSASNRNVSKSTSAVKGTYIKKESVESNVRLDDGGSNLTELGPRSVRLHSQQ